LQIENNLKDQKMKKIILIFIIGMFFGNMSYSQNETMFIIHTEYGDMVGMLYNDTPLHRDNFIKLVEEGWFNTSTYHRVIKDFMIQGGGHDDGKADIGYTIPAEILPNHFHKKGALSAARTGDAVNPQKRSSGSQFYIVQGKRYNMSDLSAFEARKGIEYTEEQKEIYNTIGGTPHLDGDYTVFGEIIEGFEVIDLIANVRTGYSDKPVKDVTMTIEIVE
jgi:peptidyl-prolyl cis-trans isomerase B (cyclophilin B)